ncbi:hypothetical protein HWV62_32351 [Athelia sp. TMB]|nr:hypothetical protein HWV62_32351 [Athelia sp. TMB]
MPIRFEPIQGRWQQVHFNTASGFSSSFKLPLFMIRWLGKDELTAILQARYKEHVMEERTFISPRNKAARTSLYVARLDRASLERQMSTTAERAASYSFSNMPVASSSVGQDILSKMGQMTMV